MRFPTMWYVKQAKAQTSLRVSDQSLCKSLEYFMTVKLLTEQHLEFLSLKRSLFMSNCHIVGNHMSLLMYQTVQIYVRSNRMYY